MQRKCESESEAAQQYQAYGISLPKSSRLSTSSLPDPLIRNLIFTVLITLLSACSRSPQPGTATTSQPALLPSEQEWFEFPPIESIRDCVYSNGHQPNRYTLLETVGGGVAMIDIDLDGYLDLYFVGGGIFGKDSPHTISGVPGRLYLSRANRDYHDCTSLARIESNSGIYSHGVHAWDFDQDGFGDLIVTGYGGQSLYHNLGDGTFEVCTASSGIEIFGWSTAAASGDFNEDGLPDLYIARYCKWSLEEEAGKICGDQTSGVRDSCPPQMFAAESDLLFLSNGDGTFLNASHRLNGNVAGRGLGVLAADLNADGRTDVYVANDAGPNQLYLNTASDRWDDEALLAGVSGNEFGIPEGSMGVASGDVNGDSQPDLFVTNFELENNSLYLSSSPGIFQHATVSTGLGGAGFEYVGFGTALADFDGDGWQDLFILNGNVFYQTGQTAYLQPPLLYKNNRGRFKDITTSGGEFFRSTHAGRGLAVGDLDNDGTLDFVAVDQEKQPAIGYGKRAPANWIYVQLVGRRGLNTPIGSRVEYQYEDRIISRWCTSGEGYLSASDQRFLLPVSGDSELVDVTVRWPSGDRESFARLPVRRSNILIEGHGVEARQTEGLESKHEPAAVK